MSRMRHWIFTSIITWTWEPCSASLLFTRSISTGAGMLLTGYLGLTGDHQQYHHAQHDVHQDVAEVRPVGRQQSQHRVRPGLFIGAATGQGERRHLSASHEATGTKPTDNWAQQCTVMSYRHLQGIWSNQMSCLESSRALDNWLPSLKMFLDEPQFDIEQFSLSPQLFRASLKFTVFWEVPGGKRGSQAGKGQISRQGGHVE